MSQNDIVALNAAFANWREERATGLASGEAWLYFCLEQFLKRLDLSDNEIQAGITDGGNDGGFDAIYFLANDELVREDTVLDPKSVKSVRLVILQVKGTEGFTPNTIRTLVFTTGDLLDLSKPLTQLANTYNPDLLSIMRTFKEQYQKIAGAFPHVSVEYYYITKGDEVRQNAEINNLTNELENTVKTHLRKADFAFHLINAQGLLDQIQVRPPRQRTLVCSETPVQTNDGYVGLVRLKDYFEFMLEPDQTLARRIFESNVRGYWKSTSVNTEIRQSLRQSDGVNFWLLNNGITILSTQVTGAGAKRLLLEDAQIVNGVQTSREIHGYFSDLTVNPIGDERTILVRIIETNDATVRDKIVKATNRQNRMPSSSLRATDEIHRQIETLFRQSGLYYDRLKGVHKDEGKPVSRIVSMEEVIQAVVTIILQRPDDARARPSKYIDSDEQYALIFGANTLPLSVYLYCVRIVAKVERYLRGISVQRSKVKDLKFYVATYLVCEILQNSEPTPELVLTINADSIDDAVLSESFKRIERKYRELGGDDVVAKGPKLVKSVKRMIRLRYKPKPADEV